MSDLQIVKEEPTNNKPEEDHDMSTDIVNSNSSQLSLINHANIPPLPHLNTSNSNNANSNPFGPSYTSHHKSAQAPFPPPFSTSMPSIPNAFPPHPGYTHTPFPPVPFPSNPNDATRSQHPYPIPNPMFYAPVFNQQPPMHYNSTDSYNTDNAPNSSSATPPIANHCSTPNANTNTKTNKSSNAHKPYSFTPGMQPGAYYLIPLNTPNGQSSTNTSNNSNNNTNNHQPMTPYMPLINQTENKTDSNHIYDTSSPTSNNHTDSESGQEHDDSDAIINHQPPFLYGSGMNMNTPFLNMLSPINQSQTQSNHHLPFSIPLTPTNNPTHRDPHQFPPPPLPLPYPDINPINGTQFSLAPIMNRHCIDREKTPDEDKKNIIVPICNKNEVNTVSSFIMQQSVLMHRSQPLSFPPLPTNNPMFERALLTPERDRDNGSSSDQDMDVALGTMDNETMPMIENDHSSYYHNITPFDKVQKKHKSKSKTKRDKLLKRMTKKTRKHHNRKKVKSHCLSPSEYQDISVYVPALNKMKMSPQKINTNGRRMSLSRSTKKRCVSAMEDIPDLSDPSETTNTAQSKRDNNSLSVPIPPSITNMDTPREALMEVAYSQQYPQVGFPYIYNADADHGKKFTCKFMDANTTIGGHPGFCDRLFGQKCHWMRHCLEKHVPTEMSQRYQCRVCNMKYAQNSSLKEHVAIMHSNQPPSFQCPYCSGEITFTRWTSVLRHCRNQHPDQEEPKKEMKGRTKVNCNKRRKRKKSKTDENSNCMLDLDDTAMPPLNIMPSVNMNISMNQMLSNNSHHPNFIAGVAILPPNLHRNGNGIG